MNKLEIYDQVVTINVDPQNDFAPNRFYPIGKLAVPDGEAVVPVLNTLNEWTRDHNGEVIFTGDWHKKGSKHFKDQGGPWDEHCMQHTAGAAFHENLEVLPQDTVAHKGTGMEDDGYSGWFAKLTSGAGLGKNFLGPDMDERHITVEQAILTPSHFRQKRMAIVVGGLATDYCVKATVLDALKATTAEKYRDKKIGIFVVRDAVRAVDVNAGDGEKALKEMEAAGAILTTVADILNNQLIAVEA